MRKYKPRREKPLSPPIDIQDMRHSYFVHDNEVYRVADCSSTVFRAAVLTLAPYWLHLNDERGALLDTETDLYARWWLLCELAHTDRPMTLYASRESAEKSCGVIAMRV